MVKYLNILKICPMACNANNVKKIDKEAFGFQEWPLSQRSGSKYLYAGCMANATKYL